MMHQTALHQFQAAVASNRLHHAWMLQGPRGIGKRQLAEQCITTLLPETEQRLLEQRAHPDVMVLDQAAATKTGTIPVEEVRKLATFAGSTKAISQYKILLIDAVDNLNTNAANALLKLVEEPRPNTIIFLINHAPGSVPITLRSRCRLVRLRSAGSIETPPPPAGCSPETWQTIIDITGDKPGLWQQLAAVDAKHLAAAATLITEWRRLPVASINQQTALLKAELVLQKVASDHLFTFIFQSIHQSIAENKSSEMVQRLLTLQETLTARWQEQQRLMLDWGQVYLSAVLSMRKVL